MIVSIHKKKTSIYIKIEVYICKTSILYYEEEFSF